MKNMRKVMGIIAIVAVITIGMAACPIEEEEDTSLSGSITIGLSTNSYFGPYAGYCQLVATYSGREDVSFQWKKGAASVGTDDYRYIPAQIEDWGDYTVTVSFEDKDPKTSAVYNVLKAPDYIDYFGSWTLDKATSGDNWNETVNISNTQFILVDDDDPVGQLDFTISVTGWTKTEKTGATNWSWWPVGYTCYKLTGTVNAGNTKGDYEGGDYTTFYLFLSADKKTFKRTNFSQGATPSGIQQGTGSGTHRDRDYKRPSSFTPISPTE
jgi:hypothetical protein